jgi:putative hydrolase of the HAD superfamily
MRFEQQVLVFDADDTLWENNHLFERVIDDYLDWLAHPTLGPAEIRAVLLDIEAANAAAHGYGSQVFLRSLRDCFRHLNERPATPEEHSAIDALAGPLLEHRVEPGPGVVETLEVLGARHTLLMLTKGAVEEQQRKIDASALAPHFRHIHMVGEKNVDTYRGLARYQELVV